MDAGVNAALAPGGNPWADSATVPLKPDGAFVTRYWALPPCTVFWDVGFALMENGRVTPGEMRAWKPIPEDGALASKPMPRWMVLPALKVTLAPFTLKP